MAVTQYIGSRYVPLFADPIEWSSQNTYEPLTIVIHEGNSYTSKQAVPKGIEISNEAFWALTGNYNAQIELYRRETAAAMEAAGDAQESADNAQNDIDVLLPKSEFSEENTVKAYIDKRSISFENVTALKSSENIQVGSFYTTEGFYSAGDNGGANYLIVDSATPNNMDVIACDNGLYAILKSGLNNPVCYGADSSGTNDSSSQINYCIEKNHNGLIEFPNGTYRLATPIELDYMLDAATCIDFGNSNLVSTAYEYAIGIGTKNFQSNVPSGGNFEKDRRICFINNFHLVSDATYAVVIERNFLNVHMEHFEIETSKNGICVGVTHTGLSARPTDAYIHDFCITNRDMRNDYVGITINDTDNKISDGRIYGFKTGMYGVVNFVDQVHFLATNLPTDGSFQMDNDWCCIHCTTYAPKITNCYCDSIPCFFKPISRCDSFTVSNLYVYSYSKEIMSEASIFDLTALKDTTTPFINITDCLFMSGTYPNNAKFIGLPNLPEMVDGSSSFLRDANLSGNKISNLVSNTGLIKDIFRKQVGVPFRNRWFASATAEVGKWVPMGTLLCPRSENIILESQAFNSMYAVRIQVAKQTGQIIIEATENMGAAPYSTNLEYKLCTNNDGYIDVYFRVRNNRTPSYYTVTKLLAEWAIMLPAYGADYAQSMPSYTTEQLAGNYTSVVDVNVSS